jgi:CTP:molybdopterin cytidylyltransferase MocA
MDEGVYGELSGDKGGNARIREGRRELMDKRRKDEAVLVDIPDTPDAEDFEVAQEIQEEQLGREEGAGQNKAADKQ